MLIYLSQQVVNFSLGSSFQIWTITTCWTCCLDEPCSGWSCHDRCHRNIYPQLWDGIM